jgi:hypothetical protein
MTSPADIEHRLRDTSGDPYFVFTPGVQEWLEANWNLRIEAADTIAQLVKERDEARETNRELHRRVQFAERFKQSRAIIRKQLWDFVMRRLHQKIAAESRASKAEAEAATLREALERAEIELEAAKAFGGGWFGNVKESVRNHYRVDARRARTQQHGAKE